MLFCQEVVNRAMCFYLVSSPDLKVYELTQVINTDGLASCVIRFATAEPLPLVAADLDRQGAYEMSDF